MNSVKWYVPQETEGNYKWNPLEAKGIWKPHSLISDITATKESVRRFKCIAVKSTRHNLKYTIPLRTYWYTVSKTLTLNIYRSRRPLTRRLIPHSLNSSVGVWKVGPSLTPLSSSWAEFLCLPLGFLTNSFSLDAWSSFSMLFPALITLTETRGGGGKVSRESGYWECLFWSRNRKKTWFTADRKMERGDQRGRRVEAGCTRVPEGTWRLN